MNELIIKVTGFVDIYVTEDCPGNYTCCDEQPKQPFCDEDLLEDVIDVITEKYDTEVEYYIDPLQRFKMSIKVSSELFDEVCKLIESLDGYERCETYCIDYYEESNYNPLGHFDVSFGNYLPDDPPEVFTFETKLYGAVHFDTDRIMVS